MSPIARRDTGGGRDIADDCRTAHREICRFLDWAGYSDPYWRESACTVATHRLREGMALPAVIERAKADWSEHCRYLGRQTKQDPAPVADVTNLLATFRAQLGGMGENWTPTEPWWERCGQRPGCHDWQGQLNRNRAARGLPAGPPW